MRHVWQPGPTIWPAWNTCNLKAGLLTAGPNPLPDNADRVSGSLIIASFLSLDAAQEWAEQDPYVEAGVYEEILIKPYKAVFK